jgi:hypothetical protein
LAGIFTDGTAITLLSIETGLGPARSPTVSSSSSDGSVILLLAQTNTSVSEKKSTNLKSYHPNRGIQTPSGLAIALHRPSQPPAPPHNSKFAPVKSKQCKTIPNMTKTRAKQIQIEPNSIGGDSIISEGYGDQSVKSPALPNPEWIVWPVTVFLTFTIARVSDLHKIWWDSWWDS